MTWHDINYAWCNTGSKRNLMYTKNNLPKGRPQFSVSKTAFPTKAWFTRQCSWDTRRSYRAKLGNNHALFVGYVTASRLGFVYLIYTSSAAAVCQTGYSAGRSQTPQELSSLIRGWWPDYSKLKKAPFLYTIPVNDTVHRPL